LKTIDSLGKLAPTRHERTLAQRIARAPGWFPVRASRSSDSGKSVVLRALALIVILAIGGAIAFLMIWDIPPPKQPIDATITKELPP